MKSVIVVIPTTGSKDLKRCIDSVMNQTYEKVDFCVVCDGPEYFNNVLQVVNQYDPKDPRINILILPFNTGKNNFYGHRIFAASGYLFDHDYICYLDQDNWYDSSHVSDLVGAIEYNGLDWAFTHRKIYNASGEYVCEDNCESLGKWPVWNDPNLTFIDTSGYMIKMEIIQRISGAWFQKWGGDRFFFRVLAPNFPNFDSTGKHTVNYQLGGNPGSVKEEFFLQGNAVMQQRYPDGFPWAQKRLTLQPETIIHIK